MEREQNIRRFTATELDKIRAKAGSKTNLALIRSQEVENSSVITQQMEDDGLLKDWYSEARSSQNKNKKLVSLRLDNDVLEWFRSKGPGYQTRINSVLNAYIKFFAE